ncbi:XK-related protein 9 [Pimephales promelas]|uniref:XK-related protein 9 n=1 Tax=Pimephales promelas TaxID=90988 RepID=UPI001955E2A7|nr:XK-related protein 9 [Pimephales promelas]XP_039522643.1 XK-related protein 9 [Pimephales promelas]KAG1953883.1 XK-related protein [Pimephales promelas]
MPQITIMTSTGGGFTTFRWLCTVFGLLFYLGDIVSDLVLSVQYFRGGHATWAALTLLFVLVGSVCIQIFSYAWFKDDKENDEVVDKGLSTCHLIGIHVLQIGIFTRYYHLLKKSFKTLRSGKTQEVEQLHLFALATDLSMLRMFETFLESVPQLVLQVYIILEHNHRSNLQYISMAVSFVNIAWATVDYRRCLRRSLTHINEMPCGIPTAVYLFYKIFTITPRILCLTLFIMLSPFSTLAMALIWLVGTTWAFVEKTDFCISPVLEHLYRAIVGVILVFTFFNIKGVNTRVPMTVYYIVSVCQNLAAPILLYLLKPESEGTDYFLPILFFILITNSLGLGLLALYYNLLHPPGYVADEVDGIERLKQEKKSTRLDRFLQM